MSLYVYMSHLCACVCVWCLHGISELKAIHCKPPHSGLHTSLVTQQWFCTLPLSGNTRCCPPILSPSGFPCTEYIAFKLVLGKEGLNNTGMDVGEVSSTCLPRSHWTNVSSHTLSLPPSPSQTAAFPPYTHG